jgi:hypothetical protein
MSSTACVAEAVSYGDGAPPLWVWHRALRPNDEEATWTPIACGGGIALPGPQQDCEPTCSQCSRL